MTRYTARQLPRQPGARLGGAILPPRTPRNRFWKAPASADIAVIGAGFAGLTAARRITQLDPAASVAVLEAGVVGQGPAGRNSGFMIDLPHDLASEAYAGKAADADLRVIANNRIAIGWARDIAAETQMPVETFNPGGKINGGRDRGRGHQPQPGIRCLPERSWRREHAARCR